LNLPLQLPHLGNNSGTLGSYYFENQRTYIILAPLIASFLSIVILATFSPIVQTRIESKGGKKPKAYFQFWASQVLIFGLGVWIVVKNSFRNSNGDILSGDNRENGIFFEILVPFLFVTPLLVPYFSKCINMNTPTQCCCCCKHSCHVVFTCGSIIMTTLFTTIFIASIPSIILIYYLYPIQTLIRLPFVINSILYLNSVSALLVYQVEKCFYQCTPRSEAPGEEGCRRCTICVSPKHKERAVDHNKYYSNVPKCCEIDGWRDPQKIVQHFMQLVATLLLLVILMLFIIVLSDLLSMDRSNFTEKNQVDLLFLLVPTIALLFGSVYKLDFFFKGGASFIFGDEEKSKEANEFTPLLNENATLN
jgi:hypothetical protein